MTPTAQWLGAGLSWLVSAALWVSNVKEHLALGVGFLSVLLTVLLIWNAILDNCKKRREEREAHRKELRDIEEAACRARQASGDCPKRDWNPPEA